MDSSNSSTASIKKFRSKLGDVKQILKYLGFKPIKQWLRELDIESSVDPNILQQKVVLIFGVLREKTIIFFSDNGKFFIAHINQQKSPSEIEFATITPDELTSNSFPFKTSIVLEETIETIEYMLEKAITAGEQRLGKLKLAASRMKVGEL